MASTGRVKSMHWYRFSTPNKGILIDLDTGIEYPFRRETITRKDQKWNVELYDTVSFDIVDGKATNVILLKKFRKDRLVTLK